MLKTILTRITKMPLPKGTLLKFAAALAILCTMIIGTANAQVMKRFGIGPGTSFSTANYRAFYPPAGAQVGVLIIMDENPGQEVPIVVDVFAPSASSIGGTTPHGPLIDSFSGTSRLVSTGNGTFGNVDFGCPSSWRIRVRTENNRPSPVRVTGRIFFTIRNPPTRELDMEGGTETLDPGETAERTLKFRDGNGSTGGRMGKFRIKAKWHTDAFQGGFEFFSLRVRLLRPDGSIAASQRGFSQHAPDDRDHRPRLHFTYNMTPEDATQSGDWRIQIVNTSRARLIDFDIDSVLDPAFVTNSFRSLFQVSSCN